MNYKKMGIKIDNYLNEKIGKIVEADNKAKSEGHISSGKLSASKLGTPLQWQLLYVMGVPGKEVDSYTLRKFLRGNHVEDWYLSRLECVDKQKFVEYRGVVGYVDAVIDTKDWQFPCGVIPVEVKSVANSKFKRIDTQGADRSHKLQAGLYALALGTENFAVSYVATDDYRILTFVFDTADFKDEIDGIISRFDEARASDSIPAFVPEEKWQANKDYNNYPEFSDITEEEIKIKVEAWKKLQEVKIVPGDTTNG